MPDADNDLTQTPTAPQEPQEDVAPLASHVRPSYNWEPVKLEYFNWVPTIELAKQFGIQAQLISNKATQDNWVAQRQAGASSARAALSREIRSNLIANVLTDSRRFRRMGPDSIPDAASEAYDVFTRGRERLVATAARLLNWDAESRAQPKSMLGADKASVIDV